MKGFDSKFSDFPDFIIGITKEIWEDRNVTSLNKYYAPDMIVRSPGSVVVGNQDVISATMQTLAEFPDRTLLGEDVIWTGTPETGMLSSHRLLSCATKSGIGGYGHPSGTELKYRVIADCHAINNQINDEWLIRDQGAIVRQLGKDPKDFASELIKNEGGNENCVKPLTPSNDLPGPYKGKGNDNQWGQKFSDILKRLMDADFGVIFQEYDRACQLEYPGGVTGHSHASADKFWLGLRSSFPSATFKIEHVIGRDEDEMMPPRAAVRWSLFGKHDGLGTFGTPTGAEVYVLGISHVEFGPWGIRREYTLYDEVAIWKQIILNS